MLKNDKVSLIKADMSHVSLYHKWRNDYEVMCNTMMKFELSSYEEVEKFFIQYIIDSTSYMIYSNEFNKIVGITSLVNIDTKNRNAEFIIDIGEKDTWGHRIAGNAVELMLSYAFNELNLHKVYLRVFSFNEKAIHIYKKYHFEIEGTLKEMIYRNNQWHDIVYMALSKELYFKLNDE